MQGLDISFLAPLISFLSKHKNKEKGKSNSWQQVPSTSAKYPQICRRGLLYPELHGEQHSMGIYQFIQACLPLFYTSTPSILYG